MDTVVNKFKHDDRETFAAFVSDKYSNGTVIFM
jgi:hypothetical protein